MLGLSTSIYLLYLLFCLQSMKLFSFSFFFFIAQFIVIDLTIVIKIYKQSQNNNTKLFHSQVTSHLPIYLSDN